MKKTIVITLNIEVIDDKIHPSEEFLNTKLEDINFKNYGTGRDIAVHLANGRYGGNDKWNEFKIITVKDLLNSSVTHLYQYRNIGNKSVKTILKFMEENNLVFQI